MHKLKLFALLACLAICGSGCIIVLGVKDIPDAPRVVEIDGEYYVIEETTYTAEKVDAESVTDEETTAEVEEPPAGG